VEGRCLFQSECSRRSSDLCCNHRRIRDTAGPVGFESKNWERSGKDQGPTNFVRWIIRAVATRRPPTTRGYRGGRDSGDGTGIGFTYNGTKFSVIAYPGAVDTAALAINVSGKITGQCQDVNLVVHGFLYDGQTYATIDPHRSTTTEVVAINESGVMVGTHIDPIIPARWPHFVPNHR
jgi:hypothetical protein